MASPLRPPWPEEILPILERAITCDYATLTRAGNPVTWPVTPYLGDDTLDVSTGLAYPMKAERARADPRVALLFADPVGSGLADPPTVLVQGLARVRDADLQANTDRYVERSFGKLPAPWRRVPSIVVRANAWYWARIWVEVTPLRILWWPGGRADRPPRTWAAPPDTSAPPSDPAPRGPRPTPWRAQPPDWRERADDALGRLGSPSITTVGQDGLPTLAKAAAARRVPEGFRLELPAGMPPPRPGPGCLTFHAHAEVFVGQENAVFVGEVAPAAGAPASGPATLLFRVERLLADFSLPGGMASRALAFVRAGVPLRNRVGLEAERRGQPVPVVRLAARRRTA